jgi:LuxR family capsular biosynthesis transcriptional activator
LLKLAGRDGGLGTMIQCYRLCEDDFRGERFADWPCDLKGNNDLISSKSIKPESLDELLGDYLNRAIKNVGVVNLPTLSLSRTESSMLRMWMAGQGTIQISDQMNIKAKTVSSHKGNIKRKIKTHNKQVIYHVVRLTDNVTNGIFVNMR